MRFSIGSVLHLALVVHHVICLFLDVVFRLNWTSFTDFGPLREINRLALFCFTFLPLDIMIL